MKKIILSVVAATLLVAPASAQKYAENAFAKLDANGDGSVTLEEWTADKRNPKNYGVGDADGDGKMTLEEYKALQAHWRAMKAAKDAK